MAYPYPHLRLKGCNSIHTAVFAVSSESSHPNGDLPFTRGGVLDYQPLPVR